MELRSGLAILFTFFMVATTAVGQLGAAPQQSGSGRSAEQQGSDSGAELLDGIVARMEEAQNRNRQNYRAYTMTRDFKVFGSDEKNAKSEVIADITFVPPDRKTFTIEKAEGSDRGVNVVKKVLKHEADAAEHDPNQDPPGAICRRNYKFALLGEGEVAGQPSWILELNPLRDDTTLIRGKAWVDKNTYLVHRIEGELAKNPSWWLKRVYTTISFGNAAGMWLQIGTRAVADVRMFGTHTLDSQVLKVQTADQVARQFSPAPPDFLRPGSSNAGENATGALVSRSTRPGKRRVGRIPAIVGAGVVR